MRNNHYRGLGRLPSRDRWDYAIDAVLGLAVIGASLLIVATVVGAAQLAQYIQGGR